MKYEEERLQNTQTQNIDIYMGLVASTYSEWNKPTHRESAAREAQQITKLHLILL